MFRFRREDLARLLTLLLILAVLEVKGGRNSFVNQGFSPYSSRGYQTDTIVWRDCETRRDQLDEIMDERLTEDPPRPRLRFYYADVKN